MERYRYNAYGERDVQTASFGSRATSSYDWEYSFTTRRLDAETGLQHSRYRYLHHQIGKWITRDPISYWGDPVNIYRYISSSPSLLVDPGGLSFQNPTEREKEDIESCKKGCAEEFGWYNPIQRFFCQGLCDNLATGTPDTYEKMYNDLCPPTRKLLGNTGFKCLCAVSQVLDFVPKVSDHGAVVALDALCAGLTTVDTWCTAVEKGTAWDTLRAYSLSVLVLLDLFEETGKLGPEEIVGLLNGMAQNIIASESFNPADPQFECLCEISDDLSDMLDPREPDRGGGPPPWWDTRY